MPPLLIAAVEQASFGCDQATGAAERAICADRALAGADRAMATAYRRALAALSPTGRTALRDEQRRFVGFTERECRPGGLTFIGSGDGKPETFAHCLLLAWQARTRALAGAVTIAGGRRFATAHRDRAKHVACDDCTSFPAIRTEEVALVQLDTPRDTGERAWNAQVRRRVASWLASEPYRHAGDAGAGDVEASVTIAAASPELISATVGVSSHGAGAAHPNYASETLAWSFRLGRALTATDLFTDPRATALQRLVTVHIETGGSPGLNGCDRPMVTKSKFTLDREGARFRYDPYELGGYPCGGTSKVSWAELRPFLKRPLPFDPARLAAPVVATGVSR